MPVEPPPTPWDLPDPTRSVEPAASDPGGLVAVGADLEPGTLLAAYRRGLFPMPVRPGAPMGWWAPDPRAVVPLDGLRVSRSLRRSCRRFEIRVDTAFEEVVARCADPRRPHGWIDDDIAAAYVRLHELSWAHSVEAWTPSGGGLAGGLYGVAIGGLFAGESMFHVVTDASKVALVALCEHLRDDGGAGRGRLLDVQWLTSHLASLGAVELSAVDYRERLEEALSLPLPPAFTAGAGQLAV